LAAWTANHVGESNKVELRFQIAGWIIFLVCSGLFIINSIRAGDMLGLAASLVFLLGCLVFLAPYVLDRGEERG
jgi:hypothetical protein